MDGGLNYRALMSKTSNPDPDRYVPVVVDGVEYMGECHDHGIRKRISPEMMDEWAEAELERRTTDGMLAPCAVCGYTISTLGICECGALTAEERALRDVFGPVQGPGLAGPELPQAPRKASAEVRVRPLIPTAAEAMRDLPEDASPEEVAAWKADFREYREWREKVLRNTVDPFSEEGLKIRGK